MKGQKVRENLRLAEAWEPKVHYPSCTHMFLLGALNGQRLCCLIYLSYSDVMTFNYLDGLVVIQGSGGMLMVDPLFQRVLVEECQRRKIPVIFDEVFTGFWRLGVEVRCPCSLTCIFSSYYVIWLSLSFFPVCCRTTLLSTRYSLFCKADDWWDCTIGSNIGNRCCV